MFIFFSKSKRIKLYTATKTLGADDIAKFCMKKAAEADRREVNEGTVVQSIPLLGVSLTSQEP